MSESILVLDPSGVIRRLLSEIIRECGYRSLFSVDGEDALAKLGNKEHSIRLVFLEWHLPGITGLDFLIKLKSLGEHMDLPVVFVTTESNRDSVVTALQNGASDYITKPFSIEQIKHKIKYFVQNEI